MDKRFEALFRKYNEQLKPLVAQIEGHYEKFETPLLENLMVYWECIVQLHQTGLEQGKTLFQKADEKLDESISQSYVYMVGAYQDEVKSFEKHTSKSMRLLFANGDFIGDYNKLKKITCDNVKLTKKTRQRIWFLKHGNPDFVRSYQWNEAAYNAYRELSEKISGQNTTALLHQSLTPSIIWSAVGWIVGVAISVLFGVYVKNIVNWMNQWL